MVRGCSTTSRNKTDDMTLHVFPTEKELVKLWLQQMKQDFGDLELLAKRIVKGPRGTFRVCSLHFTHDSYDLRGSQTYLKKECSSSCISRLYISTTNKTTAIFNCRSDIIKCSINN
uniref:THAP-type domain-containing protein n=1 Tax=Pyxicephalus adspersus TaxID=30357 RepID=A0AAV3AW86_PYXAD|nr:TPA: hypothetical protein GDO54_010582 [Pyxicephalus adspersus]